MSRRTYAGTWTALITPFTAEGDIDEAALRHLVNEQVTAGVTGVLPLGTTGESPTTTMEEDMRVFEIVVEEVGGRIKVMAGTGSNCTRDAVKYTQNAQQAGVDCCLVVSPYYNKPTPEGLRQHYLAVADVGLPVMVYNIKGRTGINIDTDTLMELAQHDMIVGVKEASGDLVQMQEVIRRRPDDFMVLSGDDALTLDLIRMGGDGVVSVTSNIVPERVVHLVELALSGDFDPAQVEHDALSDLFRGLFIESNPLPVKYAAFRMGKCALEFRLPMCPPTQASQKILDELLVAYQLV
jgi:4-hydroxy-tetrahydrodipicolinate synthase